MSLISLLGVALMTASAGPRTDTLDNIRVRDPFILPVPSESLYYLFASGGGPQGGPGFMSYTSPDLLNWTGPTPAFTPPDTFGKSDYWAPEVHKYRGRYYLLATLFDRDHDACRNTRTFVSDAPGGPYLIHSDGPATPPEWFCLDGTLFIEDGEPWMVFCHEWVQVGDGEICAMRLSPDLRACIGDPLLLFRASSAPWVRQIGDKPGGRVTDGCFFHRADDGSLLMLWSSFGDGGYKTAVARSASGTLAGPWSQPADPIYTNDGGHAMIFRRFDGQLMLTLHQPNGGGGERARLFTVEERDGSLAIHPWP